MAVYVCMYKNTFQMIFFSPFNSQKLIMPPSLETARILIVRLLSFIAFEVEVEPGNSFSDATSTLVHYSTGGKLFKEMKGTTIFFISNKSDTYLSITSPSIHCFHLYV